jgi:hypothetical protein
MVSRIPAPPINGTVLQQIANALKWWPRLSGRPRRATAARAKASTQCRHMRRERVQGNTFGAPLYMVSLIKFYLVPTRSGAAGIMAPPQEAH